MRSALPVKGIYMKDRTVGSNIKKSVSPDGGVTLNFKGKGGRVGHDRYMPLFFVILLLPVSCTVSSPFAFMTFDKIASRNELQSGTAILWVLLSLFVWAGIIYAYNHRRTTTNGKLIIVPAHLEEQEYGVTHFAQDVFNVHPYQDFAVRTDEKSDYQTYNTLVVGKKNGQELTIAKNLSQETAEEIVRELKKALSKGAGQ